MRVLKWVGIVVATLVVFLLGAVMYFKSAAAARLDKDYTVDVKPVAMPFALTPREIEKLRAQKLKERKVAEPAPQADPAAPTEAEATPAVDPAAPAADPAPTAVETDVLADVDLKAIAKERAIERGKRYVESRAGCTECHGQDFGGKTIIDSPVMGTWNAPNITRGGVTAEYTSVDWVRILRHGIKRNGKAATMPSTDFTWFSDQEISDIGMYIMSMPKQDRVMPPSTLGPVMAMLIAQGEMPISAEVIDHTAERPKVPPRADTISLELGKHLTTVCTGCHGATLSGGPIHGGDPSWLPARNLTFHETGLATWTLEQFTTSLRQGTRPDGTTLGVPMAGVVAYTSKFNDEEIASIYEYLKTLPPKALGNH